MVKIFDLFLDLVFPKHCVGCKKEGMFLCSNCQKKILLIKKPSCYLCGRLTPQGQVCSRCRSKSHLTGLIVAGYYEEPLKEAIHIFKYEGAKDLSKILGVILVESISQRKISKKAILMPIPLHPRRLSWRGYNQSELLAEEISKVCKLRVASDKLKRIQETKPQIELSGQARRQNIKTAFSWQGESLKGQTIILIDDVCTTGGTLEEAAKILRIAGARQVWGAVLAKG